MKLLISTFVVTGLFLIGSCKRDSPTPVTKPPVTKPEIISLSPSSALPGVTIKVTGKNFAPILQNNIVFFDAVSATAATGSTTELEVVVPSGLVTGSVNVKMTANNVASNQLPFTIEAPLAVLSNLVPGAGLTGTIVHLSGQNFSSVPSENTVLFNNITATVTSASSTGLFTRVPPGLTAGSVTVKVTVFGNTTTGVSFTVGVPKTYSRSLLAGTNNPGNSNGAPIQFNTPVGGVINSSGKIYLADRSNNVIRTLDAAGNANNIGNGIQGFLEGNSSTARFYFPEGVAIDAAGNLFVTDQANYRIRKIDPSGNTSTLAGGTSGQTDGTGSSASFGQSSGIAISKTGDLFVADRGIFSIRKVTPAGVVTTFAGSSGSNGYVNGSGSAARFNYPTGIAIDVHGNLYVCDQLNHRVRKIDSFGNVTTVAGNGTAAFADGTAANASFNYPWGIAVDSYGNLFVADVLNNKLRKIDPTGNVTTVDTFISPAGVFVDSNDNIYVTDLHHVTKLTAQ